MRRPKPCSAIQRTAAGTQTASPNPVLKATAPKAGILPGARQTHANLAVFDHDHDLLLKPPLAVLRHPATPSFLTS
jgi:hypothetical protein